jgi:hypothetical protein
VEDLENAKQNLRETVDLEKDEREDYQERVQYEAEERVDHVRKVGVAEREKLEGLLKMELTLVENTSQQEVTQWVGENKRMAELVALKQREIERLLGEMDELREGRLLELE